MNIKKYNEDGDHLKIVTNFLKNIYREEILNNFLSFEKISDDKWLWTFEIWKDLSFATNEYLEDVRGWQLMQAINITWYSAIAMIAKNGINWCKKIKSEIIHSVFARHKLLLIELNMRFKKIIKLENKNITASRKSRKQRIF